MKNTNLHSKGFTLIELLVVIAIIGLLSSVVLASLNSARNKAKIVAFKSELIQFRNLLQLEYSDTGSYANLTITNWAGNNSPSTTCDLLYVVGSNPSKYTAQANAICKKMVEISGDTYSLYVVSTATTYSIQGYLDAPDSLIYCVGSTGVTYGMPYNGGIVYSSPGCSGNL